MNTERLAIGKLLDMLIKYGTLPNMPTPHLIRDAQIELIAKDVELSALRERVASSRETFACFLEYIFDNNWVAQDAINAVRDGSYTDILGRSK